MSLSEVDTFLFKIQLQKLGTLSLKGTCSPTGVCLPKEGVSCHTKEGNPDTQLLKSTLLVGRMERLVY